MKFFTFITTLFFSTLGFSQGVLPDVRIGSMTLTQGTAAPTLAEVTQVTTVADVAGALGGKYFTLNAPNSGTAYYAWVSVTPRAEVTTVTAEADSSGSLNNDYFLIYAANGGDCYYVWFNINAAGVDPAPVGCDTGVEITGATDVAAADLGNSIQTAVHALGDFNATDNDAGVVTITAAAVGTATDSVDGNTGWTIITATQGISASVDPAPSGKTAVLVTISGDATQGQVGDAVQAAIDGLAAFTATDDNGGVVTITAVAKGPATDATAATSGFAVAINAQGALSTDAISSSSVLGNVTGWKICNNAVQSSTWLAVGKTTDPETDGVRLKKGGCFECLSCTGAALKAVKVSSQASSNLYSVVQFKQQ